MDLISAKYKKDLALRMIMKRIQIGLFYLMSKMEFFRWGKRGEMCVGTSNCLFGITSSSFPLSAREESERHHATVRSIWVILLLKSIAIVLQMTTNAIGTMRELNTGIGNGCP